MSDVIQPHVLFSHGIAYLAGIKWQIVSNRKKAKKILKDAPAYYMVDHHIGIRCAAASRDQQKVYALAIVLSCLPGILPDAIIVWHLGDDYGCIGLKDRLPVPGFDIVCLKQDVAFYVDLFSQMMQGRIAVYTNDHLLFADLSERIEHLLLLDLSVSLHRPPILALPKRRFWRYSYLLLGVLSLILWYAHGCSYFDVIHQSKDPVFSPYHLTIKQGMPIRGDALLSWIQSTIFSFPVYQGGWRLSRIICHKEQCSIHYDQQFSDVNNFARSYHMMYSYTYHLSDREIQVIIPVPRLPMMSHDALHAWQKIQSDLSHDVNTWLAIGIHFHLGSPEQVSHMQRISYEMSGSGLFFPYVHLPHVMSVEHFRFDHGQTYDHFEIQGHLYALP